MDNYRPLPGTLLEDLDTPSLIVDLDALDYNLQSVSDLYKDTDCKMRQHTKNIKSPRNDEMMDHSVKMIVVMMK